MHTFQMRTEWTGNLGSGTSAYTAYSRDHELTGAGKAAGIVGSSAAAFRGDAARYNPEELLVGALSACHMLWMLHLCAEAGIVVTAYSDDASASMELNAGGSGQFVEALLRPEVTVADPERAAELDALHQRAHELCFIARSVNFPVRVEAATPRTPGV